LKLRIGQGFDFHPLIEGRTLVLGGVEIPHSRGLSGHSDADVVTHALANGILGALGKGDLGSHFPDRDERYKGISSLKLLRQVWELARQEGWCLVNADLTIFAQEPRLSPYVATMRSKLAATLDVAAELINVKVSSPERLGSLGRAEGMAAAAAVLLEAR